MIKIKYKQLFDIEILHDFYTSGKSSDFQLVPTNLCRDLLKYFGLRFIPGAFGGKVFARVNTIAGKDFIVNPLPAGTKFSFLVKLKTSRFENFTQINLNKPKTSHYYFNNLVNNNSAAGLPLLVADTTSKIVSDADLLPFASNTFSYVHTNTAATQNSELRFTDSGQSFSQSLDKHNDIFNFSYDLKKTPFGRAGFFIEGSEKAQLYAIDAADNTGLFGVAEIFYNPALSAAYQFQNSDNSIETKLYKIAFGRLATKWRYIVTRKFDNAVTSINVAKTNGTTLSFTAVTGTPDGQFVLASNTPLFLQEKPLTGIKLTDQDDKVIIANLPNPSLSLVKTEGAEMFSDILITI